MTTVNQIIKEKGSDFYSVNPDQVVYDALQMMAEKDIGALPVIDNDGKMIGMFSERDYARKLVLQGITSKETKVSEIMATELYTVNPSMSTLECMAVMTEKKVRHLPVLDHNKIVGIVSIGDIVNHIIHEQNITIKDLEKYITSSGYGHQ